MKKAIVCALAALALVAAAQPLEEWAKALLERKRETTAAAPGVTAAELCAHLLPELAAGRLKRVLFMATGALLSPTSSMQGESVPGIAHAVVMEHRKEKGA